MQLGRPEKAMDSSRMIRVSGALVGQGFGQLGGFLEPMDHGREMGQETIQDRR